jgi:hypothetical protein
MSDTGAGGEPAAFEFADIHIVRIRETLARRGNG